MAYLLFPGRHLVNTRFQEEYLSTILGRRASEIEYLGPPPGFDDTVDHVVFALTSANQENSRYNPIPFPIRAVGVDRFARNLEAAFGVHYSIVGVPHFGRTARFAANTIREVEEQTEGRLRLGPHNTVVLCSTPGVVEMYREAGFSILPAELGRPEGSRPPLPIDLVKAIAGMGGRWAADPGLRAALSPAAFGLLADFPEVPRRIERLYRDPLLNDEGSLTDTRNYATYSVGMSNRNLIQVKYADVKHAVRPGKIADEGCADGALLAEIARDFPDSDLIGIEITGEFMALCRERQRRGDFGGTYVHFHQRNILDEVFEPSSIDTTICNSTMHELWSYGDGEPSVRRYLGFKFRQTRPGGRIVIRDVLGPAGKEEEVLMWCRTDDGSGLNPLKDFGDPRALEAHIRGLSTRAKFVRFAHDFLADMRASGRRDPSTAVRCSETIEGGKELFSLRLRDAVEFMSKKDYPDNWRSELNEEFAFWDFAQWKAALSDAGFRVVENPNEPASGSRQYSNPWIVENRFAGKIELFRRSAGGVERMPWPVTNMVLIGEKPVERSMQCL